MAGQRSVRFKDVSGFRRVRCVILTVTALCLQQDAFSPSVTVLWTDRELQMTFSSSSTAVCCTLPAGCTLLVQMWPSPTACIWKGLAAGMLACKNPASRNLTLAKVCRLMSLLNYIFHQEIENLPVISFLTYSHLSVTAHVSVVIFWCFMCACICVKRKKTKTNRYQFGC